VKSHNLSGTGGSIHKPGWSGVGLRFSEALCWLAGITGPFLFFFSLPVSFSFLLSLFFLVSVVHPVNLAREYGNYWIQVWVESSHRQFVVHFCAKKRTPDPSNYSEVSVKQVADL